MYVNLHLSVLAKTNKPSDKDNSSFNVSFKVFKENHPHFYIVVSQEMFPIIVQVVSN